MEDRIHFINQSLHYIAEFLDREAIEIPDDCYSEEYSDDDDFIDDSEDVNNEEYNKIVDEVRETIQLTFETPEKAAYREEIKRMEKNMEEIAEEGYQNLKAYRKKEKENNRRDGDDDTNFSDEEKAKEKPTSVKKRAISKETVSLDDDDDSGDDASTSVSKKKNKKTAEERKMELSNAAALDSDEEPAIYGSDEENPGQNSSDEEEEVDVTDPESKIGNCCLCKSELKGGPGKKTTDPWVQCPQKEVCKFTWMDYGMALEFHKIGKKIISPKFRHPFVNGKPRCKCGAIMAYRWVLAASEARAKFLVGNVFAICCVPVKEGGKCDKVIYVGKSPNKAFKQEMEEIYEAEEKEKEKKRKKAKVALKMHAREIDRDRRPGVGLYSTTLRNMKRSTYIHTFIEHIPTGAFQCSIT